MLVYVINNDGQPLMPTRRCGKIRRLLKDKKARIVRRCPFTIQLCYTAETNTQPVTLGVDAGSEHIGLSAATDKKVLYEADVELRNDIVEKLSTRREQRRTRRNRKTRYRPARFDNRKVPEGWLAPSVQHKVDTHLRVIEDVHKILPISEVIVETASFDIQKIKNPGIEGEGYQQGEQLGFWNTREYVLWRDGHTCQCCKGKSKDPILNVHHIESRKTGGDAPNNLITLCETCHKGYHAGTVKLPEFIHRGMSFKDAAFMGIMRWTLYDRLKETYPNVKMTYGYITKNIRIENHLPKEHYIDARCISGHPSAEPLGYVFCLKKVRCHNRQLHKMNFNKGGYRKANQAPYLVKGFALFDKVRAKGKEWYINGRRLKGGFVLKTMQGEALEITPSKIRRLCSQHGYITERRAVSSPYLMAGVPTANI